jgi:hypothetical protein
VCTQPTLTGQGSGRLRRGDAAMVINESVFGFKSRVTCHDDEPDSTRRTARGQSTRTSVRVTDAHCVPLFAGDLFARDSGVPGNPQSPPPRRPGLDDSESTCRVTGLELKTGRRLRRANPHRGHRTSTPAAQWPAEQGTSRPRAPARWCPGRLRCRPPACAGRSGRRWTVKPVSGEGGRAGRDCLPHRRSTTQRLPPPAGRPGGPVRPGSSRSLPGSHQRPPARKTARLRPRRRRYIPCRRGRGAA